MPDLATPVELSEDTMLRIRERNSLHEEIRRLTAERDKADERIRAMILEDVGEAQKRVSLRYGGTIIRVREKRWKEWLDDDGQAVYAELLAMSPSVIRQAVNLRTIGRKKALEEITNTYYDGGYAEFRKNYIEGEWVESSGIEYLDPEYAPKFLQNLADGEAVLDR